MKKGFIFSLDAALALLVVIALASLLVVYFQATAPIEETYTVTERMAKDAATVGLYLGKDATELAPQLSETLPSDSKFASCSIAYQYEINLGNGPLDDLVVKKYCKGI